MIVSVLVAGYLGGPPVWTAFASNQLGKTSVRWSGPVECSGTRVTREPADDPIETMEVRAGMRCHLAVKITNHGRLPVTLTSVLLPFMGPEGGPPVQVTSLEGRSPQPSDEDGPDAIDAVFKTKRKLAAGASEEFVIEFTYRPDGCSSAGVMWVGHLPEVEVRVLGVSRARSAPDRIAFKYTKDNVASCPD